MSTAVELRHDAITRLAEIAQSPCDVRLVLSRPRAIDVLHRKALRNTVGDELLRGEVNALVDVAKGRAVPMIDAVHELGLPEPTPGRAEAMSLADFEQTVMEVLG